MSGLSDEKILALGDYGRSPLFDDAERVALEYADAMTLSDRDVSDALFDRLGEHYDEATLLELTAAIAWENASSKFNRALRVEAMNAWQPGAQRTREA